MAKGTTSFRLSEECIALLKEDASRLGLGSMADIVEIATRYYHAEKMPACGDGGDGGDGDPDAVAVPGDR